MNRFKVSQTLMPRLEVILTRRCIEHSFEENFCNANVSGRQFHKIVLRAKMETMQKENGSKTPYVAEIETRDPQVMREVGNSYKLV